MASIAVELPVKVEAAPEPAAAVAVGSTCAVRAGGWAAIDVDAEQKVEARVRRKLTFKDHLFSFLVDYNRH
jgi:hypothetical protein